MVCKNKYFYNKPVIIITCLLLFLFALTESFPVYAQNGKLDISLLEKIYKEIQDKYVEEIHEEDLVNWGIDGMLSHLDPYTDFYARDGVDILQTITTGEYEGVGLYLDKQDDRFVITQLIDNAPAAKEGILPGDELISINNRDITHKRLKDITGLIKGQRGTTVSVGIKRIGEPDTLHFTLVREKVEIEDIPFAQVISEGIGYIRLMHFSQKAPGKLEQALRDLKRRKIHGLILDIRGNPGGLLSSAVGVADLFSQKDDVLVTTRGRKKVYTNEHRSRRKPILNNLALTVVVNKTSASAAEIVAGAVQDLDLGVVIGQKTFGKGLVQTVLYPNSSTAMKMTTAEYYTPSGRCIQGKKYIRDGTDLISESAAASSNSEAFYTKGGRIVYGGGGILPDIEVSPIDWSSEVKYLLKQNIFMKFAVHYVASHQDLPVIVEITDELKTEFSNFLKMRGMTFPFSVTAQVTELIELIKEEPLGEEPVVLLQEVLDYIHKKNENWIDTYSDEINYFLKQDINWIKDGERGRIAAIIDNDIVVQEAISLLTDTSRYHSCLNSQPGEKLLGKSDKEQ